MKTSITELDRLYELADITATSLLLTPGLNRQHLTQQILNIVLFRLNFPYRLTYPYGGELDLHRSDVEILLLPYIQVLVSMGTGTVTTTTLRPVPLKDIMLDYSYRHDMTNRLNQKNISAEKE